MGAWGPGLFQDDVAEDVRDDFRELVGDGLAGPDATDALLRKWADAIQDTDDGPIFWIALAATQVGLGRLEERVRDQALVAIRDGGDLDRWEGADDKRRRERNLAKLEQDLLGPQKPPVKVKPRLRTTTPLRPGDLVGYHLIDGRLVLLRVLAWVGDDRDNYPVVDLVDWVGTEPPKDAATRPSMTARSKSGTEVLNLVQHRAGEFPASRIEILARGLPFSARRLTPSLMFSWSELDRVLKDDFGL